MGIPYYFYKVVQANQGILKYVPSCERLFLDYNSIIHVASAQVVSENPGVPVCKLEDTIFRRIISYTEAVVKKCPPSKLLYIAIDGVAPLAKMTQQRRRRHLTAYRNQLINDYKKKCGMAISDWDSNCITPATEFMTRLNEQLRSHFLSGNTRTYEVYVSGPDEQGEGEHKIISYIKGTAGAIGAKDVIYGMDADLIMLSLTCKANGIYLMRERGGGGGGSQEEIDYVSIDEMRKYVSLALHGREDEVFMLDYIFICFLLGNDFLPHPLMLSIKHSGIDILCNAYKSVYEERGGADTCIVEKKKTDGDGGGDGKAVYAINYDFLKDMLRHLMMVENDSITEIMKDYDQMNFINKRFMDPVDKYAYDVDFTPLREKSTNRKIISQYHPKNPMWRNAYYYHLFGINPHTDLQGINDTCKNFLDGLEWNVNYYFNGVFSHNWFYKYPHAPTIKDLYHMVVNMTGDTRGCEKKCEEELVIKPWEQLLIVLPYHSKYLVPEKYRKYITDARLGCSHMYPTEFYIHTHLKRQLWECIPILPVIDIHRFLRMVRSGA